MINMRLFVLFLFLGGMPYLSYGQPPSFLYHRDYLSLLEKTRHPDDSLSYERVLKRFVANDTTLTDYEVLALMIGFSGTAEYKPYNNTIENMIGNAMKDMKFQEAFALASGLIDTQPLNLKGLMSLQTAASSTGDEEKARYHGYQIKRIFNAMQFSGDGLTPETAIFALGPNDGVDFIRHHIGTGIETMGSGRNRYKDFLEILGAKFRNGESRTYYFVIEHAFLKKQGKRSGKKNQPKK